MDISILKLLVGNHGPQCKCSIHQAIEDEKNGKGKGKKGKKGKGEKGQKADPNDLDVDDLDFSDMDDDDDFESPEDEEEDEDDQDGEGEGEGDGEGKDSEPTEEQESIVPQEQKRPEFTSIGKDLLKMLSKAQFNNKPSNIDKMKDNFFDKHVLPQHCDTKKIMKNTQYVRNPKFDGGNCYNEKEVEKALKNPDLNRFASLVLSMIEMHVGTGIYESPRFDPVKLITGILSKNVSLSRIRREEMQRKRLLVLNDISGSCGAVCNNLSAACYKLIDHDSRVLILFNSNNGLWKLVGENIDDNTLRLLDNVNKHTSAKQEPFDNAWKEFLDYISVSTVLGFGDADASHTYRAIAESGREFLYFCNGNIQLAHNDDVPNYIKSEWRGRPKAFLRNINDPKTACNAIMDYLTNNKGKVKQHGV